MLFDLLNSMSNKLGLIVLLAFFLSRSRFIKGYLQKTTLSRRDKIVFSIIFGVIGIIGTYSGVPVQGAIANSRSIGVIVAGLFGGPSIGLVAGLIAGIHRMIIPDGRFTAIACGISTILGGIIAGYSKNFINKQKHKWFYGALITIFIEAIQMLIILLIAKPFDQALSLVQLIFVPMAFINAFGTGIFILLIQQIHEENDQNAAAKAGLALKIATKTLPYLRKGLNTRSAFDTCEIIRSVSGFSAVAITNKTHILAHVGEGSDHHKSGLPIHTKTTQQALMTGTYTVANSIKEIECLNPKCKLQSAIVVPLYMKDSIIGTLKLYKTTENSITSSDLELAKGLAYLFSTQIELSQLAYQEEMVVKSELRALQAQIHPHFLFNALNTIISFCRTDALKARELLIRLSEYLRTSFKTNESFIPVEKEIEHIQNYLSIEEARFSDRLHILYQIEAGIQCDIPPLILQPLVENALKHGLAHKTQNGLITLSMEQLNETVQIKISDNGCGFSAEKLEKVLNSDASIEGVGLQNVIARMRFIYGTAVEIISHPNEGTSISISIPNKLRIKGGTAL
jgi:two-component system, LytTR family, sensor histidine kinase LytS